MERKWIWILFLFMSLQGCVSGTKEESRTPAQIKEVQVPSRDDVMGPNRARASARPQSNQEYGFRNIASAFPDPGKNMLLKDRALPKSTISGALDQSPWQHRTSKNPKMIEENQKRFSNSNKGFYSTPLNQREALILSQSPKKEVGEAFYQSGTQGQDDAFETNNKREEAFDLSNAEDRWLGLLGAPEGVTEGVQWDEDWYKIRVSPQYRRLILDLRFLHYLGDVDMKLYDANGNLVAVSQGVSEDEFLHLILDKGGTYYVQIFGSNRGNRYDFRFSTFFTGGGDDEYEENDFLKNAFDLRSHEGKWLSEIQGEGVAADNDYFLIRVGSGKQRLVIDLRYEVERGDVDLRVLDSQGKIVASSAHIENDDYIDFTVPAAGNYYLKIYPFSPQSTFNMYDLKWSTQKSSQKKSSNNLPNPSEPVSSASR